MQLDYLLQAGYKGYIETRNNVERICIQEYLYSCGYSRFTSIPQSYDILYIFIPFAREQLTYSCYVDYTSSYATYIDITQEIRQLAGLLPIPYEYW